MRDSVVKLQIRPWLILIELLKYLLFGWGLLLCPVVEMSIFIQTRLFDQDTKRIYPEKKDWDASLPENLPDIEVMSVGFQLISFSRCSQFDVLGRLLMGSLKIAKLRSRVVWASSLLSCNRSPWELSDFPPLIPQQSRLLTSISYPLKKINIPL